MPPSAAPPLAAGPPDPFVAGGLLLALVLFVLAMAYLHRLNRARARLLDQRRRVENALRESEVFYHSLVESLPQTILRKDVEGHFTFASARFTQELGLSLE